MQEQADLFLGDQSSEAIRVQPLGDPSQSDRRKTLRLKADDFETAAQILAATGEYRILRKLKPRPLASPRLLNENERIGVIVDTETTGLDHAKDEIIELGMVAFVYDDKGRVGDIIGTFSKLREPSVPISPEITRITGITAEMAAGQSLNTDEIREFIAPAHLVIAHNARFDRPFCERLIQDFSHKAWACSHIQIPWSDLGFEGSKLGYLLNHCGWFHQGHRAVEDCHALLEVLASPLETGCGSPLAYLLTSAERSVVRIWAEGSPFDMKDALKMRGYCWNDGTDGRPKSWFIEIPEEAHATELMFLQQEIYRRAVEPFTQRMTAFERFRALP